MDLSFFIGAILGAGVTAAAWALHVRIIAKLHDLEQKFVAKLTVTKLP